jgi:type III pantothenate kinase
MNLTIDLGNTFAKTGLFEGNNLVETHWNLTFDALKNYVQDLRPQQIIVSTVARTEAELQEDFSAFCQKLLLLQPTTSVPLTKDYDTPHTLGADRVAAAVGAMVLFPKSDNIVIDLGTCITYDWVDAQHIFHGGIISPGMRMRFKAMNTFTKRLPLIEAEGLPDLVGKNTKAAMQSGVVNGLIAEINGLITEYQAILNIFNVILTGGDAHFFESRVKVRNFVVPELVLVGLNNILQYNENL